MSKGVMRMTATTRSEYRSKCVIDIKYLPPQLMLVGFLCHDQTRKERNNNSFDPKKFLKILVVVSVQCH